MLGGNRDRPRLRRYRSRQRGRWSRRIKLGSIVAGSRNTPLGGPGQDQLRNRQDSEYQHIHREESPAADLQKAQRHQSGSGHGSAQCERCARAHFPVLGSIVTPVIAGRGPSSVFVRGTGLAPIGGSNETVIRLAPMPDIVLAFQTIDPPVNRDEQIVEQTGRHVWHVPLLPRAGSRRGQLSSIPAGFRRRPVTARTASMVLSAGYNPLLVRRAYAGMSCGPLIVPRRTLA